MIECGTIKFRIIMEITAGDANDSGGKADDLSAEHEPLASAVRNGSALIGRVGH